MSLRTMILISTFAVLAVSETYCVQTDTSKILFTSQTQKVKYTLNRQIGEVPFTIKNKSKEDITVSMYGAFLVRGKHYDPLEKTKFRVFEKGKWKKTDEFLVRAGREVKFVIMFKPFTLYTGSKYSVLGSVYVNGIKMDCLVPIEMYKLEQIDKNQMKNTEK